MPGNGRITDTPTLGLSVNGNVPERAMHGCCHSVKGTDVPGFLEAIT